MVLLGDQAQVKACFGPFRYSANFYARQVHGLRRMYHCAWKSFQTNLMNFLGDMGHVESCIATFRDGVRVDVGLVHGLRKMYHRLRNHFGHTQWYS
jgi:hypothetical protein